MLKIKYILGIYLQEINKSIKKVISINKKCLISLFVVILWMCLIFFMSSMNTNESNSKSKGTINQIIEKGVSTTNGLGITDKHPSESKIKSIIEKINPILRKVSHAGEFMVLTLLVIFALKTCGIKGNKIYLIALVICFLYACTDEYHQTFVNGRTGQFTDVLIDTAGGAIGCAIVLIKNKVFAKDKNCKNK